MAFRFPAASQQDSGCLWCVWRSGEGQEKAPLCGEEPATGSWKVGRAACPPLSRPRFPSPVGEWAVTPAPGLYPPRSIPRVGETLVGFFASQDYILKQPLEEYLK